MDSKILETISIRGGRYYHQNDGYFYKKKSDHHRNNILYVKCIERSCKSTGKLKTNVFGSISASPHSHPPNRSLIEENNLKHTLLMKSKTESTPFREIYNEVTKTYDSKVVSSVPFKRFKKTMQRARSKVVKLPSDLTEYGASIIYEFDKYGKTKNGEAFFVESDSEAAIFISPQMKKFWTESDCTFSIYHIFKDIPRIPEIKELLILGIIFEDTMLPMCYILVKESKTDIYQHIFQRLKFLHLEWKPKKFICSYEKNVLNAVKVEFPDSETSSSWVHYCQCILRKLREIGLEIDKMSENMKYIFKMFTIIPLLPIHYIERGYEAVKCLIIRQQLKTEKMDEFLIYFQEEWLTPSPLRLCMCAQQFPKNAFHENFYRTSVPILEKTSVTGDTNIWWFTKKTLRSLDENAAAALNFIESRDYVLQRRNDKWANKANRIERERQIFTSQLKPLSAEEINAVDTFMRNCSDIVPHLNEYNAGLEEDVATEKNIVTFVEDLLEVVIFDSSEENEIPASTIEEDKCICGRRKGTMLRNKLEERKPQPEETPSTNAVRAFPVSSGILHKSQVPSNCGGVLIIGSSVANSSTEQRNTSLWNCTDVLVEEIRNKSTPEQGGGNVGVADGLSGESRTAPVLSCTAVLVEDEDAIGLSEQNNVSTEPSVENVGVAKPGKVVTIDSSDEEYENKVEMELITIDLSNEEDDDESLADKERTLQVSADLKRLCVKEWNDEDSDNAVEKCVQVMDVKHVEVNLPEAQERLKRPVGKPRKMPNEKVDKTPKKQKVASKKAQNEEKKLLGNPGRSAGKPVTEFLDGYVYKGHFTDVYMNYVPIAEKEIEKQFMNKMKEFFTFERKLVPAKPRVK